LSQLPDDKKMIGGQAEMCSGCLETHRLSPQSGFMTRKAIFVLMTASLGFCSEPCTTRACWFDQGVRARLAGHYAEAETAFLNALAASGDVKPTATTIQHSLGILYTEMGRYQDAELALRQALADNSNVMDSPATAKQLGEVLAARGRYSEADQLLRKALNVFESITEGTEAETAATWNSLGMLHYKTGELSKADKEYKKALALLPATDPAIAGVLANLGEIARFEHRYPDAEAYLRRALALQEQSVGMSHPRVAITLNHLGRTYADEQAYAAAEPLYARALSIATAPGVPELPIVALIRWNLAEVYVKRRAFPQAELECRRALASATATLGPAHPIVRDILMGYAALLRQLKRKNEAREIETRAAAIQRGSPGQSVDIRTLRIGMAERGSRF
jgi:Tfp pilus assembly protein PilF